jgi:uncharacterized membrane protein
MEVFDEFMLRRAQHERMWDEFMLRQADGTTSHSTWLPTNASQVAGYQHERMWNEFMLRQAQHERLSFRARFAF